MNKIRIMEASVKKWQRIIDGKGSDGGVLDCPPCRIFYILVCIGCPIAAYSGKKFCKETPYIPWYRHQMQEHGYIRKKIYCPECRRLAIDMRDFMSEIVAHLKAEKAAGGKDRSNLSQGESHPETVDS
ncbi:MAG: hypothetical protein WBG37_08440 [Desulfobacterales bacterium]|jgi:hypothetical protein